MSIFSQKKITFTIHRRSSFASYLKSSISRKLLEFLGNYTDDVLAEYITVIVCNGKHQNQARDDLEAFLGERSGEFVSWLWDFLLKSAHSSGKDRLSDVKKASVTSSHVNDAANQDSRSNRSSDISIHGTKHAHGSLRKDEKIYHHPTSASDLVLPINMVQPNQDCTAPLKKAKTEKLVPHLQKVFVTEKSNDGLSYEFPEMRGSTMVSPCKEQSIHCLEKVAKIGNSKCSGLHHMPPSCIRNGEMVNRNSPSSTSEHPCIRQSYAAEVLGRSLLPGSKGLVSNPIETSRGSVWDRLGKPSNSTPAKSNSADASCVMNTMKGDKSLTRHALKPSMPNGDLNMSPLGRVYRHARAINPMEKNELHHSKKTTQEPNSASNIGRKRHFGEVTSGPDSDCIHHSGSDSLVGEGNMVFCDKEMSHDVVGAKHTKATTTVLVSEVLDVKQRLSQIEVEMSKLRSKQSEMEREGNPSLLAQFGTSKLPKDDSEVDVDSKTVTVTNVHFAATKEAISSHFVNCGTVVNVVILKYKATAQPKGAAYVSFAHKESVEKAVALTGTTFFSRTIRVIKKLEAAGVTSGSAPLAGETFKASLPRVNRTYPSRSHLQWRREPLPAPSPSPSPSHPKKSVEDEKVASSTPEATPTGEANPTSGGDPHEQSLQQVSHISSRTLDYFIYYTLMVSHIEYVSSTLRRTSLLIII